MRFSANAIIFLGALPAVYAQVGKSTKSSKATPSPVTAAPVAAGKSTKASKSSKVTAAPVSASPVSSAPVSLAPVSSSPVSFAPVSFAPFSTSPVSTSPVSFAPVSSSPVSFAPFSTSPVSSSPVSFAPFTAAPSESPVTSAPSAAPVTSSPSESPVTSAPSAAPVTASPVSPAPITSAPVSNPTPGPTPCPTLDCNTGNPAADFFRCTQNNYDACVDGCCVRNPTSAPVTSLPTASPSAAPVTSSPSASPVTTAPSASPTAAPSASPTTTALAFSSVGLGECVDGNNMEFSQIEVRLGTDKTAAGCNAACSNDFYHPELVGFSFGPPIGFQQCYCYYSGGVVPSIIPPQGYNYRQHVHTGNGAIMSTKSRTDWECFVYAKGTGSPTSPGATNAPISPSPTGSITPAPTPTGIATFSQVGPGLCTDSNNDAYHRITAEGFFNETSCAGFCGKIASPDLLGFSYGNTTQPQVDGACWCYFDGGKIPSPPSGLNWEIIDTYLNVGFGPIKGSEVRTTQNLLCYAFSQGTGSPTVAPSDSP